MSEQIARDAERERTVQAAEAIFHRLWGKAVGTPEYVKDEWKTMQVLLDKLA